MRRLIDLSRTPNYQHLSLFLYQLDEAWKRGYAGADLYLNMCESGGLLYSLLCVDKYYKFHIILLFYFIWRLDYPGRLLGDNLACL